MIGHQLHLCSQCGGISGCHAWGAESNRLQIVRPASVTGALRGEGRFRWETRLAHGMDRGLACG